MGTTVSCPCQIPEASWVPAPPSNSIVDNKSVDQQEVVTTAPQKQSMDILRGDEPSKAQNMSLLDEADPSPFSRVILAPSLHMSQRGLSSCREGPLPDMPTTDKTEEVKALIREAISSIFIFESLSRNDVERLMDFFQPLECTAGLVVLEPEDTPNHFYIVESGLFESFRKDRSVISQFARGGHFGDRSLVYAGTVQPEGVRCMNAGRAWALDRATFRYYIAAASARADVNIQDLKEIALLAQLDDPTLQLLAAEARMVEYSKGQRIANKGEITHTFCIVIDGSVICTEVGLGSHGNLSDIRFERGAWFGDFALNTGNPRMCNITAETAVKLMCFERAVFMQHLAPLQETLNNNMDVIMLSSVLFLADLTPEERNVVISMFTVEVFSEGVRIVQQGEVGMYFVVIRTGTADVTLDGRSHLDLPEARPGNFVSTTAQPLPSFRQRPDSYSWGTSSLASSPCSSADYFGGGGQEDRTRPLEPNPRLARRVHNTDELEGSSSDEDENSTPQEEGVGFVGPQPVGQEVACGPSHCMGDALFQKRTMERFRCRVQGVVDDEEEEGSCLGTESSCGGHDNEAANDLESQRESGGGPTGAAMGRVAPSDPRALRPAPRTCRVETDYNIRFLQSSSESVTPTESSVSMMGESLGVEQPGFQLEELNQGDYFGEHILMQHSRYTASVTAKTALTCFVLHRDRFLALDHTIQERIRRRLNMKHTLSRGMTARGENMPTGPARSRVHSKMSDEDWQQIRKVGIIGSGTFGTVYLAMNRLTRKSFAVKVLTKEKIRKLKQEKRLHTERDLLLDFDSPFIVHLRGSYEDPHAYYLLLELVQGGELQKLIHTKTHHGIPALPAKFYSACIATTLLHIHRHHVAYRDLKPENVMIAATGYTKLVDFGLAKRIEGRTFTLCGTPEYLAPEVILGIGHTQAADWWSLGVLIFEMIAGHSPFVDLSKGRHQDQMQVQGRDRRHLLSGTPPRWDGRPALLPVSVTAPAPQPLPVLHR